MSRGVATAAVLHVFVAGFASGALAHFDVAVQQNAADGRLSVHGFDFAVDPEDPEAPPPMEIDKRVFGESFDVSGSSLFTDDPGFVSRISPAELPSTLVPVLGGQGLYFNILPAPSIFPELGGRNLSFWDGTGAVAWSAVPDDEALKIFKGPFFNPTDEAVADGSTTEVEGFLIGGTLASGSLHKHIKFLMLPDGLETPPTGPDHGVYLLLVELGYPAYAEWIPTWLLFKARGQADLGAAVADVAANFKLPLCDDGIDNDKDGLHDMDDPGCESAADMSERAPGLPCDDGIDNDGDGRTDFDPETAASPGHETQGAAGVGDVGCESPHFFREDPWCQDGIDNNGTGGVDFDGGFSIHGVAAPGGADSTCETPSIREGLYLGPSCGLGFELCLVLPLLRLLSSRKARRTALAVGRT